MKQDNFIMYGAGSAKDFRGQRQDKVKEIEYITFNLLKQLEGLK